ncbi:MAG: outer membrane protein transport protein [Pseudomonadota bacterium]
MKTMLRAACIVAALAPATAFATLGYFSHGYGLKAKGMGGVGIALPQDATSGITNPANLGFVGNRLDAELDWFRPIRDAEILGNGAGRNGTYDGSGRKNFLIPGVAYNRVIRPDLALGILVYGNGGMNTTFDNNPFGGAFGGGPKGGVDYMQLFIAPTIAWKPNQNHSIGLSVNIAYHQFGAQGLEGFAGFSSDAGHLTNRGRDASAGIGVRLGWTGKLSDRVTLGAMLQPKTNMGKLGEYKGLFRNQGELDIPATYGVGIAVKATPKLTIAGDIQQIDYGKVPAIGTPSACLFVGACTLGASNGPGFGWHNMTTYKIGASYEYSRSLTLRAGFATGKQPIPANETLLNIIFPAVVQDHLTLGATWTMGAMDFTVGYMHAFRKKVNGSGSIPLGFGSGEANLRMHQDSLGFAIGWKM